MLRFLFIYFGPYLHKLDFKCSRPFFDLTPCLKQTLGSLLSRWPQFTCSLALVQDQMFMIICLLSPHATALFILDKTDPLPAQL